MADSRIHTCSHLPGKTTVTTLYLLQKVQLREIKPVDWAKQLTNEKAEISAGGPSC